MRRALTSLCLSALLLFAAVPAARPYTQQFTSSSQPIHWTTNTVTVFLAASLDSPPSNIKAGSDVAGAARRALRRWSDVANINFDIRTGGPDAINTSNDGFNVISVSTANAGFVPAANPGRTRVSFDPNTGAIAEADVAINPNLPFSTDGTYGTYDLESTLVHEIGHFLGLDHSALIGASMQPRQAQSFTSGSFTLTQTSVRTLSEDDIAGIRTIYGQRSARAVGSIQGNLNYPFAGAHVWAESASTGRVVGSAVTKADGSYRIDQVPPGDYRVNAEYLDEPVRVAEITAPRGPYSSIGTGPAFQTAVTTSVTVTANGVAFAPLVVVTVPPTVNARVQGLNGIVHAGPMPVAAGNTYRYYVGGDGIDQIPANGFFIDSPFFQIDASSYQSEPSFASQLGYPVVSFNLRVLDNAKWGDYTLRLRRGDTGETVYLAAGIVVDPYTDFVEPNPIDNADFFVRMHYLDFLSREADAGGLAAWVGTLNNCAAGDTRCDRVSVSAAFFRSQEFEFKGRFVFDFYKAAFARLPLYNEIIPDIRSVTDSTTSGVQAKKAAFTNAFVQRQEFKNTYDAMTNTQFVNTLMDRYGLPSIRTPNPATPNDSSDANKVTLTRADLINGLTAGTLTRAQVLRAIADSDQVSSSEFNSGFVAMQYYGYLRRDPEPGGYSDWLRTINANPNDIRSMVSGFMNSLEYRSRFGQT